MFTIPCLLHTCISYFMIMLLHYDFYLWRYLTIFFRFYFNVDSKQNSNTLQCLYFRHQPLVSTKETQILGRTVGSRPDLLCTTSNPRTHRPILIVCQVFLCTKLDFYNFSYFQFDCKIACIMDVCVLHDNLELTKDPGMWLNVKVAVNLLF